MVMLFRDCKTLEEPPRRERSITRASVLTVKFKKARWTWERVAIGPLWDRKLPSDGRVLAQEGRIP